MKFGKRLRGEVERSSPQLRTRFLSYKKLKKQIKFHEKLFGESCASFYLLLDREIDKVNEFFVDKEEDFIIKMKELRIKMAAALNCSEEKLKLQKETIDFHAEMISLLQCSVLNFTGLMKIVKKHKKIAGTSTHLHLILEAMHQPFFSPDSLLELMKECEYMLCRLFCARSG